MKTAILPACPEWQKWLDICDAIERDDVELTCEEFAPFSEMFNRLVALGVPFDDGFVLRVRELQRSMVNRDLDANLDNSDESLTEDELGVDHHWELDACLVEYGCNPQVLKAYVRKDRTTPQLRAHAYSLPIGWLRRLALGFARSGQRLLTGDQITHSDHRFPTHNVKTERDKYLEEKADKKTRQFCRELLKQGHRSPAPGGWQR